MHPDLEKLIRLQAADSHLRRVEAEMAQVPGLRSALTERLAEEKARLESARTALAECQKSRRQHEGALQDLEVKRSRYKGQLMEVKTNKEYTAMLHEIEGVERDIRSSEDQILAEMERGETLAAEAKREEALFKDVEREHETETRNLDERAKKLTEDVKRLTVERDLVAETLPDVLAERFARVARLRGVAVAEARDGMCQVCHVKLRLQMFAEVKRNDEIMECPTCNRILFYEAPIPTVSPGP